MKRPDFDNMTEKEKQQFGDFVNASNRRTYAAMLRRRSVSEARIKEELGIESEVENEH